MGAITELNGFASTPVAFTDNRTPRIAFSWNNPESVFVKYSTQTFPIILQTRVDEMVRGELLDFKFIVDVSAVPGTTIVWPILPDGITAIQLATGKYALQGITTPEQWQAVTSATIVTPTSYFGTFAYKVEMTYYNFYRTRYDSISYNINVTIPMLDAVMTTGMAVAPTRIRKANIPMANETAMTVPQLDEVGWSVSSPRLFNISTDQYVITPQVISNSYPTNSTWTVTLVPSVLSVVSSMISPVTGGTFSFNTTTKVTTITGTKSQVNTRLLELQMTATDVKSNFYFTMTATNATDTAVSFTTTHQMNCYEIAVIPLPTTSVPYTEDVVFSLSTAPLITATIFGSSVTASSSFVYTIRAISGAISMAIVNSGAATVAYNASTKTLSISGTKAAINNVLLTADNIRITPEVDSTNNINLEYKCTLVSQNVINTHLQTLTGTGHDEVSNIAVERYIEQDIDNRIFLTNTPQITDLDVGKTYTVTISSTNGSFALTDGIVVDPYNLKSLVLTGTKAQINAQFAAVRYKVKSNVSNHTITYTQSKSGYGTQLSTTIPVKIPPVQFNTLTPSNITRTVNQFTTPVIVNPYVLYFNSFNDPAQAQLYIELELPEDSYSSWSGTDIAWFVPEGCVRSNPAYNKFRISGIMSIQDWYDIVNTSTIVYRFGFMLDHTIKVTVGYTLYDGTQRTISYNQLMDMAAVDIFPQPQGTEHYFKSYDNNVFESPAVITYASTDYEVIWTMNIKVAAAQTGLIVFMSSTGTGGTAVFNTTTNQYTITGTTAQLNQHINSIKYTTADVTSSTVVTYTLTNDLSTYTISRDVGLMYQDELNVFPSPPTYMKDAPNIGIFNTYLSIYEFDQVAHHKIMITSSVGNWGTYVNNTFGATQPTSIVINNDTVANVNTKLNQLVFYSPLGYTAALTFTITYYRDNVVREIVNWTLLPNNNTYSRVIELDGGINASWTPAPFEIEYGYKMDYEVIGSGGRGSQGDAGYNFWPSGGGGGSAGKHVGMYAQPIENKTYYVTNGGINQATTFNGITAAKGWDAPVLSADFAFPLETNWGGGDTTQRGMISRIIFAPGSSGMGKADVIGILGGAGYGAGGYGSNPYSTNVNGVEYWTEAKGGPGRFSFITGKTYQQGGQGGHAGQVNIMAYPVPSYEPAWVVNDTYGRGGHGLLRSFVTGKTDAWVPTDRDPYIGGVVIKVYKP